MEDHNLEFVEEINIAIYKYGNTVGLEFDLDAARGTCRGDFAARGTRRAF